MAFAVKTKVPIDSTRLEIEKVLKRYGADRFAFFSETERAVIVFEVKDRRLKFDLPLPIGKGDKGDQARRSRWRALLLCIKAKLESVASNIETFEEAFLAHVVMPDGKTVAEHAAPAIQQAYLTGSMVPLLPAPEVP